MIEKVYIYHVLTDKDNTCLKFIFISDPKSNICEKKFRDIIFEVIIANKIYGGFDSSHEYWGKLNVRKENLRKCFGCFETEHIDNPCSVTIACNPKEYYEMFEDIFVNKKQKGIKKGSPGMDFENYVSRIISLNNCDTFVKPPRITKKYQD